jgi:hypothetical protein
MNPETFIFKNFKTLIPKTPPNFEILTPSHEIFLETSAET